MFLYYTDYFFCSTFFVSFLNIGKHINIRNTENVLLKNIKNIMDILQMVLHCVFTCFIDKTDAGALLAQTFPKGSWD